jgi:uncharacterized repeat protein (TIGR03803 family)
VTQAGDFQVFHSFTAGDGVALRSRLSFGPAGSLYGTTRAGGDSNNGTVFRWDPPDQLTVYYSFSGSDDGRRPMAGVYVQEDGLVLYGTTYERGDPARGGGSGCGAVFPDVVAVGLAEVSRKAR